MGPRERFEPTGRAGELPLVSPSSTPGRRVPFAARAWPPSCPSSEPHVIHRGSQKGESGRAARRPEARRTMQWHAMCSKEALSRLLKNSRPSSGTSKGRRPSAAASARASLRSSGACSPPKSRLRALLGSTPRSCGADDDPWKSLRRDGRTRSLFQQPARAPNRLNPRSFNLIGALGRPPHANGETR